MFKVSSFSDYWYPDSYVCLEFGCLLTNGNGRRFSSFDEFASRNGGLTYGKNIFVIYICDACSSYLSIVSVNSPHRYILSILVVCLCIMS